MAPLVTARLRAFLLPDRGVLLARPYAVVAAIGLGIGIAIALSGPGQRLEWNLYDQYARRAAAGAAPAPGIVVVAIDEPSFTAIGLPWPWPRSLHATLIDQLVARGAKTIAFDILFDVPSNPDDDAALAEAIGRAGNVVLAADQAVIDDRGYSMTQWTEAIPQLTAGAVASGVVRIPFDPDGVLRRALLILEGRPSLALAVASRTPGFALPPGLDTDTLNLFRFNGEPRRGIMTASYYQALDAEQSLPADFFAGKHVLIGRALQASTIDARTDHFETPVAIQMPGVEVHATIVDALLRNRFIADPLDEPGALVPWIVAAGTAAAVGLYFVGPSVAPIVAAGAVLALMIAGYAGLAAGVRLPMAAPSLAVATVYATTAAYRFVLNNRERRLIKRAFQNYVAPAIVEQMLNDPSRLKLGGEEYEVTVLFSDLEGFTTLSERVTPAQLSEHLGRYFREMLNVLLPQRGTLDKLIGDSVMMYFGCPIPDPRHPFEACDGALAMQERMLSLNAQWEAEGLPHLRTRIGINTGVAVAGNMGTDTIFNYTIIGDCVNLASRLEGVNKEYGSLIILGENTWERVHQEFETRELDWIRVKGKTRPVAIYELIARAGAIDETRREVVRHFGDGLALYRDQQWIAAAERFDRARQIDPDDGPSRVFAARCAHYAAHPPADWDGVHVMHAK